MTKCFICALFHKILWGKKGSFDMRKVLPFERSKKQPISEFFRAFKLRIISRRRVRWRGFWLWKCLLIPKAKRKQKPEAGKFKVKRKKLNPKPHMPKNHAPRVIPEKKSSKSNLRLRMLCQELLLARLQSGSNQINRSPCPSLLEDDSRRATCI